MALRKAPAPQIVLPACVLLCGSRGSRSLGISEAFVSLSKQKMDVYSHSAALTCFSQLELLVKSSMDL